MTTHSHSHMRTHNSQFSFLPGPRFLISPRKVRPRDGGFQCGESPEHHLDPTPPWALRLGRGRQHQERGNHGPPHPSPVSDVGFRSSSLCSTTVQEARAKKKKHRKYVLSCSVTSDSVRPHGLYPAGSSVRGILQARTLGWVAISSSRFKGQTQIYLLGN